MPTSTPGPNERLRSLIGEARWTNGGLARMVNAVGAEAGISLRYDRSAVSHWLSGARPRGQTPSLIAEAFSRRLGRPVTIADTGLVVARRPLGDGVMEFPTVDAVDDLLQLARGDLDRVEVGEAKKSIYSLGVLRGATGWADISARAYDGRTPPEREPVAVIGPGEVAAARRMAGAFTVADRGFGGGHARGALAAYLAFDVARWLRMGCRPDTRRELFAVASDLTALAGFMSFDDQEHGLAQRYFLVALRFAVEADSRLRYALVLRRMSLQATHLGHTQLSRQLVDEAFGALPEAVPPRVLACLHGQAAVTDAGCGDRRAAVHHLRESERQLRRTTATGSIPSYFHPADLAYQAAQVLTALHNPTGAATALSAAIRKMPATERRSQALALAWLAELRFADDRIGDACAAWQQFLDRYPYLHSSRATTALKRMRKRLSSVSGAPAIRTLLVTAASFGRSTDDRMSESVVRL